MRLAKEVDAAPRNLLGKAKRGLPLILQGKHGHQDFFRHPFFTTPLFEKTTVSGPMKRIDGQLDSIC
jgi:hypothetical protein